MKRIFKAVSSAALCALTASVFALDYPTLSNPTAQAFLQQYQRDRQLLADPAFFAMPSPSPEWPCAVAEIDQYKLAGMTLAHPELRKSIEKSSRKHFREAGMSADMLPTSTYSGIQISLLRGECSQGKLNGPVELLGAYEQNQHSVLNTPMGEKSIRSTMDSRTLLRQRLILRVEAGEPAAKSERTMFMQSTTQMTQHYDDPAMEAMTQKTNAKLGTDKPTTTLSVVYTGGDGLTVTVMEMETKKVTGGLFGVNVTPEKQLMTTVMTPVSEGRSVTESYINKGLTSRSSMKDGKPHGEMISLMDNYLKPLKMRLDQQPGMENAREVVIDGKEMIEMRRCFQNGSEVKTTPCPAE